MIIVTGAAGLIGSAVVRELNNRGETDLLLVDHLYTSEKWLNLRSLKFSHYMERDAFIQAVQNNPVLPEGDLRNAKAIIHLGACSSTMEMDVGYLIQNNYEYSRVLAEFARTNSIRMVYASSAATYGDGSSGYEDDEEKLHLLRPLNPYGYSKHLFDLWLQKRGFGTNFAGIKYFNVFGPNEYHKGDMQSLVLKAFRQIQKDGVIRLFKSYNPNYGDGKQERDFFYVSDAAKITVNLALDLKEAGGIFNAGSGEAKTWIELAESIFAAIERKPKIEFIEMPEELRTRYQYHTCAPMGKLFKTGYSSKATPLKEAVREYVADYLMNGELRA